MSSNARRGRFKIVVPLNKRQEQEISGGLKNALDRGESLAKAKQSFLNAGYTSEDIDAAIKKIPSIASQISKPITTTEAPRQTSTIQNKNTNTKPLPTNMSVIRNTEQKHKISKKFIIILVSVVAMILVVAALLGIFWEKLF